MKVFLKGLVKVMLKAISESESYQFTFSTVQPHQSSVITHPTKTNPMSNKFILLSRDMVDRCNAVGVRIYVDAVINHMCGDGGSGENAVLSIIK